MTTLIIQLPDNETDIITAISEIVKNVKGSSINIDSDDEGLTENELTSLKRSLKEVAMIKKGELKPLSMNDLWDE
jgi:hypothetical protein